MKKILLQEIIVWLLIFIGLVVFSSFVYMIGSKNNFFIPITSYKTILEEASGIYIGTKVSIHGKTTGNVVKMDLLSNGAVELQFTIQKKHAFSITESSFIQIKTEGTLGDRYINIMTPDLSEKHLEEGSLIPYTKTFSLFSVLTENGGEAKKSIQNIINQIDEILSQINKKGFGFLSQSNQEDLTKILKSTKTILNKLETGQGTLGALINDRSVYNRLLILLGQRPSKNYLQDLSQKSQSGKK